LRLDREPLAQPLLEHRPRGALDPQRVEQRRRRPPVERCAGLRGVLDVERGAECGDTAPEAVDVPRSRRLSPPLVEVDHAWEVRIGLRPQVFDAEPEPLGVEAHEPVAWVEELAAAFGVLPRDESLADRVDAAAGAVARLEDGHAMAGALQFVRTDEACQPGADDDRVGRLRRRRTTRAPGAKSDDGPGCAGDQLAAGEPARQGSRSYAGSVRNSTKSGSSATC